MDKAAGENPVPALLLELFPPSADGLLFATACLVDDDMLREISEADAGFHAYENLLALGKIRDKLLLPAPMEFVPQEVLQLTRWSEPDKYEDHREPAWERGHIMCVFCCAALLRAAAEPANDGYFEGENSTVIQLIHSALNAGRGLPEAAATFMTWRLPGMPVEDEERPFFAFGLAALALLVRSDASSPADVDSLVDFVEGAEAALLKAPEAFIPYGPHRSFLTMTLFDLRHRAWRALAARVRAQFPDAERLARLCRRIEATEGGAG